MTTPLKLQKATESIANIDGAPWLRNQLEFRNIVNDINLDYYHLKDNGEKVGREVFVEDESGTHWLKKFITTLMERGFDALLSDLVGQKLTYTGSQRKTFEQLLGYISERPEIIRYREFRTREIQIGSGPM